MWLTCAHRKDIPEVGASPWARIGPDDADASAEAADAAADAVADAADAIEAAESARWRKRRRRRRRRRRRPGPIRRRRPIRNADASAETSQGRADASHAGRIGVCQHTRGCGAVRCCADAVLCGSGAVRCCADAADAADGSGCGSRARGGRREANRRLAAATVGGAAMSALS